MHELSLCRSIHTIVDRARTGRPVRRVSVQVGAQRQVVPDTLEYCWGLLTEGGPLAGSMLAVEQIPVVVACHSCGDHTTISEVLLLRCGSCSSTDFDLISGEEFCVTTLDLGMPEPARVPEEG